MTVIRQEDFIASVAGALQYISYYHPVDYITNLARAYELEQSPAAKDAIAQILINSPHVRRGPPPHLPGHRHRHRLRQSRHGRPLGSHDRRARMMTSRRWSTRASAAPTLDPDNNLRASILADPAFSRKNTGDNTPCRRRRRARPRRRRRHHRRSQRRRLRSQIQVRHAQPLRLHRRLGPQDRPHHGRRLVPARHARHRHRRHRRKSHAPRQGVPHGPHRHAGTHRARPRKPTSKNSASSSTTRSTASASAPRASAASPPSSTSRSSTTPPTPPTSPSP